MADKRGAKSKYHSDFPLLAEGYAREGMTDKEICQKLGISQDTFYEYMKKYPEFSESVKEGKRPIDVEVEKALLKRAIGYEMEETQVEYKGIPKEGEKAKPTSVKKITKQVIPDVLAQKFWLMNRQPRRFKDRRTFEGDPERPLAVRLILEEGNSNSPAKGNEKNKSGEEKK